MADVLVGVIVWIAHLRNRDGLCTYPHGPWHDDGVVVATDHEYSSHNAIDACVMWDSNSVPWLAYGSFFSGLYVLELDPVTGHPRYPGQSGSASLLALVWLRVRLKDHSCELVTPPHAAR